MLVLHFALCPACLHHSHFGQRSLIVALLSHGWSLPHFPFCVWHCSDDLATFGVVLAFVRQDSLTSVRPGQSLFGKHVSTPVSGVSRHAAVIPQTFGSEVTPIRGTAPRLLISEHRVAAMGHIAIRHVVAFTLRLAVGCVPMELAVYAGQ